MRISRKKTKLTDEDINDIVEKYESGDFSQKELMVEYKIPQTRLKRILNKEETVGSGYKSRFIDDFINKLETETETETEEQSEQEPQKDYITREELDEAMDDFLVRLVNTMKDLGIVK